ncbi:hypothetical protein BS47DRAFT_1381074 [Hydnum rufescens UP504]|uniref:Uncharacterized protein n=1 Tax=Hydnum rufescens UP504 TaxID=1448309 RepID=A0A9P6B278_9AGAM|nr:hypothetical protein BS47DRAFT_1381074 [Hydnum rufescens UP504]
MESSARRPRTVDTRSAVDSFYAPTRTQSVYEPVYAEDDPFSPPVPGHKNTLSNAQRGSSTFPRDQNGAPSHEDAYADEKREPVKGDEEAWDVYADFNNSGPRYSGAVNLATDPTVTGPGTRDGYRALITSDESKSGVGDSSEPVELVTVPAFGPEWTKGELRAMTKKGRAEEKALHRDAKWKEWKNDNRGLFGKKWLTRKAIVWTLFVLIILMAVGLAICLPRVPSFAFNPTAPISTPTNTSNPVVTRGPTANFTFDAVLDLEMSTGGNIIPLHMNNIHANVFIVDTNKLVAQGNTGSFNRKGGTTRRLDIPVLVNYVAPNDTDTTWNLLYSACKSSTTSSRPGLNILIVLDMSIRGLIGTAHTSTSISNLPCPITLPSSSV